MMLTASNPATQAIIDQIRDESLKKIWCIVNFLSIWDTFHVQDNQKKYILREAGLEKISRVKIKGKHRSDL